MIVVFGWGKQFTTDHGLVSRETCHCCGRHVWLRHETVWTWITLYHLPIIPYRVERSLVCTLCASRRVLTRAEGSAIRRNLAAAETRCKTLDATTTADADGTGAGIAGTGSPQRPAIYEPGNVCLICGGVIKRGVPHRMIALEREDATHHGNAHVGCSLAMANDDSADRESAFHGRPAAD